MSELKWQDDTGYTYSKPRSEQPVRVVSVETQQTRLIVHRLHGCTGWYMSLRDDTGYLARDSLLSDDNDLDLETAKCIALSHAIDLLEERSKRYRELIDNLGGMH